MVIDTSALLTLLLMERHSAAMARAIDADTVRLLSAVSYLEGTIVVMRRAGPAGFVEYDHLVRRAVTEIVAFGADQAIVARDAYDRFGKGRHPARLNFGDCCAYALAKTAGEPLLFAGDDFARTDIPAVTLAD
jgi:ribonuclease VapC